MRQVHPAGERLFVGFAGQTVEVIDPATGEIHREPWQADTVRAELAEMSGLRAKRWHKALAAGE